MIRTLVAVLLLSIPSVAEARRLGVFVGSNAAPEGREPLAFAELDAERTRDVFVELGEMNVADAVFLRSPSADEIVQAIRGLGTRADGDTFIFYYSGHADDRALLLGGSELPLPELLGALNAVEAKLALHLVDACRSGALTRRKGASLGPRFSVNTDPAGEGRAVITSSAEWEDSQESDRLGGSFFTLHLLSGLRGAADRDGDERVTLSEAYEYVYGRTVESTLATAAGPQHPTFSYDLSGRGDVVLTWTSRAGGTLVLGQGDYLVVDEESGSIVAEVLATPGMKVTVAPGTYRVRKRTKTDLSTGRIAVDAGQTYRADERLDERVAHARLVRKGGLRDPTTAHVLRAYGGMRGQLDDGVPAVGLFRFGYELVLPWLSVMPYANVTTTGSFETERLAYVARELGAGLAVSRAFDFSYVTLRASLSGEAVRLTQRERDDRESSRGTWGTAVAIAGGIESPPILDFALAATGEVAFYTYRTTEARTEPAGDGETVTRPTFRVLLSLGWEL